MSAILVGMLLVKKELFEGKKILCLSALVATTI